MAIVKVKALLKMRDRGVSHEPGEEFEMEAHLAQTRAKVGQVEVLAPQSEPKGDWHARQKASPAPADK